MKQNTNITHPLIEPYNITRNNYMNDNLYNNNNYFKTYQFINNSILK